MNNDNKARLIIPDIHHKVELVERIRANYPGMPAIFLGDYFDDFDDTPADMKGTCEWLKSAVENCDDEFLLGNHCFGYVSYELGVRWGFCSGWEPAKQQVFHQYFPGDTLLKSSAWISRFQGWLISHASLTRKLYRSFSKRNTSEEVLEWVNDAENALMGRVAHAAFVAGIERGGPAKSGGILWCDWQVFEPIRGIRQIVETLPPTKSATKKAPFAWIRISIITAYSRTANSR